MTTTTKKKKKRPSCVERAEWAEEPKAAVKITLTANRTFSPFSYLFLFFFFLSFLFVNFTFKTKKMGNDARRSQAQQQTLTKQNAATSCKRNRRG
jgi:hypothetical protein